MDNADDPLHVYSLETGRLGEGSADKPYLIGAPETLAWLAYRHTEEGLIKTRPPALCSTGKKYKLTADLDLSGRAYAAANGQQSLEWLPIGATGLLENDDMGLRGVTPNKWTLDGAGHTISNLTIHGQPGSYQGLFASAESIMVTDLTIQGSITAVFNTEAWNNKEDWRCLPRVGGFVGGAVGDCTFALREPGGGADQRPLAGGLVGALNGGNSDGKIVFERCGNEARVISLAAPPELGDFFGEDAGLGGLLGAGQNVEILGPRWPLKAITWAR